MICLQRIFDVRVGRGYVQGRKWSVLKQLWPDQDLGRISVILWSTISAATLRASNVCYNTSDDAQVSFERHNNTTTSSHSIIRRILEADVQFLRTQRVVTEKMRQDYEKQLHSYRWQLNLAWHKDADLQEELRIAQAEIVKYREEKEQNARRIEELATRLHSKRRYPSGTQFHLQALGDGNTIQTSEKEDIHDKLFKILAEECSDNCPVRFIPILRRVRLIHYFRFAMPAYQVVTRSQHQIIVLYLPHHLLIITGCRFAVSVVMR